MYMGCSNHFVQVLLLATGRPNLGLLCTANLLHSVLSLLTLLAACSALLAEAIPAEPVLGFKFLGKVERVIYEGETRGLATSELGPEAEAEHHVGGCVVHLAQFVPHLLLGDCASVRVDDIYNHLFSA